MIAVIGSRDKGPGQIKLYHACSGEAVAGDQAVKSGGHDLRSVKRRTCRIAAVVRLAYDRGNPIENAASGAGLAEIGIAIIPAMGTQQGSAQCGAIAYRKAPGIAPLGHPAKARLRGTFVKAAACPVQIDRCPRFGNQLVAGIDRAGVTAFSQRCARE